ncbi:MAG: hypothetical protein IJ462_00555 [Clostridia bacterium]|nr:hypothetical protein [Clostridia bacterium]
MKRSLALMLTLLLILAGCSTNETASSNTSDITSSSSKVDTVSRVSDDTDTGFEITTVFKSINSHYDYRHILAYGYTKDGYSDENYELLQRLIDENGNEVAPPEKDYYILDDIIVVLTKDLNIKFLDKTVLTETEPNTEAKVFVAARDHMRKSGVFEDCEDSEWYSLEHIKDDLYVAEGAFNSFIYSVLINEKGKIIYKKSGGYIHYIGEDRFEIIDYEQPTTRTEKIIDSKGKTIKTFDKDIEVLFSDNGFVTYRDAYLPGENDGNRFVGLMDKDGNYITDKIYGENSQVSAYNDFIFVSNPDNIGGKFINAKNEEVLKIDGVVSATVYKSAIACTMQDQKTYIYSLDGKKLSQGFREIYYIFDDYAAVNIGSKNDALVTFDGTKIKSEFSFSDYLFEYSDDGLFAMHLGNGRIKVFKVAKK